MLDDPILNSFSGDGFFYLARKWTFDQAKADELLEAIRRIDPATLSKADSLMTIERLWQLPFLLTVYRDRCLRNGTDPDTFDRYPVALWEEISPRINALLRQLENNRA